MSIQPSPRPWTLDTTSGIPWKILDVNGTVVALIANTGDLDRDEVNAKLIVAGANGEHCHYCGSIAINGKICEECLGLEPELYLAVPGTDECAHCGQLSRFHSQDKDDGNLRCPKIRRPV